LNQITSMKKEKQPSAAKAARKSIHESLVKALTTIADKLKKDGLNTIVDIEKEAKKLAKKITKGAKPDHPAEKEATKESLVIAEAKAPSKEKKEVKPKVEPKSPEAKVTKPVNGSATPAPAAKQAAAKKATPAKVEKK
jgi:hypothetical protein